MKKRSRKKKVLRGITAEIDLGAASRNLASARKAADGQPLIAVVKADAYGHGAVELSRAFLQAGAGYLAVAFLSEAIELRESGCTAPVIVLFDRTDPESFIIHNLTPVIHDLKTARSLSNAAYKKGITLDVHVKVDTGMGRMGLENPDDISSIASLPNIRITGLMSHFSEADLADRGFMQEQIRLFTSIRDSLHSKGIRPLCHFANSAATLSSPEARFDAVRPGIILYGCSPFDSSVPMPEGFSDVMSIKAPVLTLRRISKGKPVSYGRTFITARDTLSAVVAAGYADGYPRSLSNTSCVLINGKRAPVMGRVCMDLIMADATDCGEVHESSEAVLLGRSGQEHITAQELALGAGTIPYEILLGFGRLARRSYITKTVV